MLYAQLPSIVDRYQEWREFSIGCRDQEALVFLVLDSVDLTLEELVARVPTRNETASELYIEGTQAYNRHNRIPVDAAHLILAWKWRGFTNRPGFQQDDDTAKKCNALIKRLIQP